MVDIGNQKFAFFAHVQPGSLRVHVGDRVKKGQVIALLGNSGNSTEPHLHFHVSDALASGTTTLGSEGLPYAFPELTLVGRCAVTTAIVVHTLGAGDSAATACRCRTSWSIWDGRTDRAPNTLEHEFDEKREKSRIRLPVRQIAPFDGPHDFWR